MPAPEECPRIYSTKSIILFYGGLIALISLLFLLFGCGSSSSSTADTSVTEPVTPPVFIIDPPPLLEECVTRDLAGTCRKNPPTMGALEIE